MCHPIFYTMNELDELSKLIADYADKGYQEDVKKAVSWARNETRAHIARTHPHTAFGGKTLDNKQFIRGKFEIQPHIIQLNIYADHFARWLNTGAYGRPMRSRNPKYNGRKGPVYPAREKWFENNAAAIESFFAQKVEQYLRENISI